MSARNGDKARFNNFRRRKLAKRQRVWAFFAANQNAPKAAVPATPKPRAATAVAAAPAQKPPARDSRTNAGKPAAAATRPAAARPSAPAGAAAGEKKPRVKAAAK